MVTGWNTASVLDAASGDVIRTFVGGNDLTVRAIFSPDSKMVLTLGGSGDLNVRLWDIETGEQIFSAPAGGGQPALFFFLDGQLIFAADNVYRLSDGQLLKTTGVGGGAIAISADGKTYATGSNLTSDLRDTVSGQLIRSFSGHTDIINCAAFSNDGKLLVTGGNDNTARVWDVASGEPLMLLSGHSAVVNAVAISPDGTKVLTGSDTIRLWSITAENEQQTISTSSAITVSALSPDGKTLLAGGGDGTSGMWDLKTGQFLSAFPKFGSDFQAIAFSPDGKLAAIPDFCGDACASVNLYDPLTGTLIKTFNTDSPRPFITALTFSADSKMLFIGTMDGNGRLWDVDSGQVLRLFKGNSENASFSADGRWIAFDGGEIWWDVSSGLEVNFFSQVSGSKSIFSDDGSLFAVVSSKEDGEKTVSVWDVSTKQLINRFSGHTDRIVSLAISPDNRLLLTGSVDKTAQLWDISSGQLIRTLSGHTAAVSSVVFTPDGKKIVTTSLDKTIRTWITSYDDLLAYACTLVGRDLTPEERILYGVSGEEPSCPQFGDQAQPLMPTTTPMPTHTPITVWTPIATPSPGP